MKKFCCWLSSGELDESDVSNLKKSRRRNQNEEPDVSNGQDVDIAESKLHIEDKYFRMEFQAMPKEHPPHLTGREFVILVQFLGSSEGKSILRKDDRGNNSLIKWDEYITYMHRNPKLKKDTNNMRMLFAGFDDKNSGYADSIQIKQSLEDKYGLTRDKNMQDIEQMDEDNDGLISYEEYVRFELQRKGHIK